MSDARRLCVLAVVLALSGCAESDVVRAPDTDRTPPAVTATEPADGAQGVTQARVAVTFSEPMATSTVRLRSDPPADLGTPLWSDGDRTVTFLPPGLRPDTRYVVTVTGRDLAGNPLPRAHTFRFATGPVLEPGAVAEGLLEGRFSVRGDERVYAVFLAYLVGQAGAARTLTDDQRELRGAVERAAPEAARRAREFLGRRPVTVQDLAEYALRMGPDLRVEARSADPGPSRLEGFDALVARLYEEAKGLRLWATARQAHDREAAELRNAAAGRLRQAVAYLRPAALPFGRLVVVPNLLGPRDSVAEVRQADAVYVVVGPSAGPNVRGVVRGFLRAVTGPVVRQYRDVAAESEELFGLVEQDALARGWEDWQDVVRESLVRAVEARLLLPDPQEQANFLDAGFGEGLVLVRHFAQRLARLERGQAGFPRVVEDALREVDVSQVRQQWQGHRR
ncbi:MAG: Ig-like domain-containing protein [bacterium]